MSKQVTIEEINEGIIKTVAKKVIDLTSSGNMPFTSITYTITNSGYGFTLTKAYKEKVLLSVRTKDGIKVHVRNDELDYAQTFPISDIQIDRIPTESAVESYKKYCVNTIYTIIKTWIDTPLDKKPELGEWHLYKY